MTTATGLSAQKRTYLDVLAIVHFVHAGLIVLIALLMLGVMVIGLGGRGRSWSGLGYGCFEIGILGLVFAVVTAYAAMNLLVGYWLKQRRGWLAIIILSALNALNVPLGTLLGVFTIVVLVGDDVRAAFEGGGAASAAATVPPPTTGRQP